MLSSWPVIVYTVGYTQGLWIGLENQLVNYAESEDDALIAVIPTLGQSQLVFESL